MTSTDQDILTEVRLSLAAQEVTLDYIKTRLDEGLIPNGEERLNKVEEKLDKHVGYLYTLATASLVLFTLTHGDQALALLGALPL